MRGVIWYNRGTKCLVRLAVSAYTLRQHYGGSAAVISDADCQVGRDPVARLMENFEVDVKSHKFKTPEGNKTALLN